jgi:ATP/maltotriose-dependent transcriptional regulator MalT
VKTRWRPVWRRHALTTGADGEAAPAATPSAAGVAPFQSTARPRSVRKRRPWKGGRRSGGAKGKTPAMTHQSRRIIDRPRLTQLLDECEARVILLLAPAGYGKTTLARQWAKTLSRSIWVTNSPAHRDVAVLAEDLAKGIDCFDGDAQTFVREYLAAHANPQRTYRRIAVSLGQRLEVAGVRWLFLDDYHELLNSPEAEDLVDVLQQETSARFVIASRQRPKWAGSRRVVYGEVAEIGRDLLAMTEPESIELLGDEKASLTLAKQAEGWPAVLALAAAAEDASPPSEAVPSALHRFFAEELFQRAPASLQDQLLGLALLPTLDAHALDETSTKAIEPGRELGFVAGDEPPELHPLLREFLLEKLLERPDGTDRVRAAIEHCTRIGAWDGALSLLTRFRFDDLVESVLTDAFKPLARRGRLETLSSFAAVFRVAPSFPPPTLDVVEADAALRDGNFALAADLASRVRAVLPAKHPLRSRIAAVEAHSNVQLARFELAEDAFLDAQETALDDVDETEALHGLALARIFGERGNADAVVRELWQRRHTSPIYLLRATTTELSRRRLEEGLAGSLNLEEPLHACSLVEDPRARTSFTYGAAYALAQQGNYRTADTWLPLVWKDINEYDLEFARPHATWTTALIQIGLRRFGEAERLLQSLEDGAAERGDEQHALNARILRARLLLQTGKQDGAAALTSRDCPARLYPSWRGEYLATRAIALAALDESGDADALADDALATSRMVEVRMLAAAARAISAARSAHPNDASRLLVAASSLGVWDPVVCALRTCPILSDVLTQDPSWRDRIGLLYDASNDLGLARRAGFRTRSNRSPEELLTPREMEVLGLIARGMRNAEIAKALFISQSTTKVHVRHILEKLGVRTRAEAVLRLEMSVSSRR